MKHQTHYEIEGLFFMDRNFNGWKQANDKMREKGIKNRWADRK
jgi:hypothetical protein